MENIILSGPAGKNYDVPELQEECIETDRQNIFIVDDNLEMISFLQSSLNDQYNVFFAFNGVQAPEKLTAPLGGGQWITSINLF